MTASNDMNLFRRTRSPSVIAVLLACGSLQASIPRLDYAQLLEARGLPTETTDQVLQATRNSSYYVRYVALNLLTERIGKQAAPALKEALNDPRMEVRWKAAHLLGTLGDKSGAERMREDLERYAPNNGQPLPPDPNVTDPRHIKEHQRRMNLHWGYGLQAARVLAELGDRRGYRLAARMAIDGPYSYQRSRAVRVLGEIAKANPATLSAEGLDPASVLREMAESEKEQSVFSTVVSFAARMRPEMAKPILAKAKDSPHQSQKMRNFAAGVLSRLERQTAKTPQASGMRH